MHRCALFLTKRVWQLRPFEPFQSPNFSLYSISSFSLAILSTSPSPFLSSFLHSLSPSSSMAPGIEPLQRSTNGSSVKPDSHLSDDGVSHKSKVTVIGSGNWGSVAAKLIASNAARLTSFHGIVLFSSTASEILDLFCHCCWISNFPFLYNELSVFECWVFSLLDSR